MIKQTNLIKRLKSLGLNSWGNKSAYTTFSHSGGRTHIGPVAEFFNRATSLAEEAAEAIEKLEAECEELKKLRLEDMLAFEGAQMRRDEDNIKLRAECEALRKNLKEVGEQMIKERLAGYDLAEKLETAEKENKELREKLSRAKNFNYPMASKYGGEDW